MSMQEDDKLVTDTYKELATERVPDVINRDILDLAGREAASKTGLQGLVERWSKPLAWAATAGLSLAIVMDITRLTRDPAIEQAPTILSPPETSVRDDFVPRNQDVMKAAQEQAEMRLGPSQQPDVTVEAPKESLGQEFQSNRAQPAKREAAGAVTAASRGDDIEEPEAELDAELTDADSSRARLQKRQPAPAALAVVPELSTSADRLSPLLCEDTDRSLKSTWLACVENLRLAGFEEEADREYADLKAEYPDE